MHSHIRPNAWVAFQLPSDSLKVQQIVPNTTVSLGKYGSFEANQILGRPYHLTFEINDPTEDNDGHTLRVVPAAELHMEELLEEGSTPADGENKEGGTEDYDLATMRTNRDTIDDASTQKLTLDEIEALKRDTTGAGREIIAKLLESHSALDQKTAFSLAKYTLRKRKKYLKRFQVLPLDIPILTRWMLEDKDPSKIMELRDELVALIGCWANVHCDGGASIDEAVGSAPSGRWLVVDDTGGMVVAAMAERMGILYPPEEDEDSSESEAKESVPEPPSAKGNAAAPSQSHSNPPPPTQSRSNRKPGMSATNNTLTVLHNFAQPNVSFLKYFSYDSNNADESHPLHTNLKSVSWMQLLEPNSDPIYANEPPTLPDETLATWKPSKRGLHHRKRRRWERVRRVVDETREGGFDGLIVASLMDPTSILKHAVPLLAGAATVTVYSPHIEPLVKLADLYSTARRTAYITMTRRRKLLQSTENDPETPSQNNQNEGEAAGDDILNEEEYFPVDPTLLLSPTVQTSRVRPWQVLPGRTHPLMSGRGGAEGYIFHGIRVIPAEGVEARGRPSRKKRKVVEEGQGEGKAVEVQNEEGESREELSVV
ncbi:tRNA (adenine(58)-N(1))-methyltransferase non-catalytic subunit trm6 [Arachnomyces sp. PD_36]|nr:tRNA (adenine(58)-N(1))-methyltransferase non-catalytic subunit trm6 [Arachnomyces sp. PD_36]